MGKHSQHLKMLETMVGDLLLEDPELSMAEAIELAVVTKNERHLERGYHPSQWFMGDM